MIIRQAPQDIYKAKWKTSVLSPSSVPPPPNCPHPVALQVSHLDLQEGQVSEDLQVVLVPLQSVAVTLDGLVVLLIRALQEAIDVPAWDTPGVKEASPPYSLLRQLVSYTEVCYCRQLRLP